MLSSIVPGAAQATRKAVIGNPTIRRAMSGRMRLSTGKEQITWVTASPASCSGGRDGHEFMTEKDG